MSCPICECPRVSEFFPKGSQMLLICEACRHVWWASLPSDEDLVAYYGRQYTEAHNQDGIQNAAREYYAGHLQALLQLAGRRASECAICDYGCSIPILLLEAKRAGFRQALGVDFCEQARCYGAAQDLQILRPDELEALPDGSLDIVRFSHTLEHSRNPVQLLNAVMRKVRSNGLVYITQPSFPVLRFQPSARDLKDSVYPEHLHFFSPISLVELAARAHLGIRQVFTHQNERAVLDALGEAVDLEYSRRRMQPYAQRGERAVSELGNYPHYAGENSALYAFKE